MIVNFIFGLLWLVNGEMSVSKTKRVKPIIARTIGAMVIALSIIATAASVISKDSPLINLGLAAPVLALIIGFANTENKPDQKSVNEDN